MNAIWINIIIAIIQVIIALAIGYWQINVAKSIARNEIDKPINLKAWFRNFLSKHSSKIIRLVFLCNGIIFFMFIISPIEPNRFDIAFLVFTTASTIIFGILYWVHILLDLIETGHKSLYCMVCKRSKDGQFPPCIEGLSKK